MILRSSFAALALAALAAATPVPAPAQAAASPPPVGTTALPTLDDPVASKREYELSMKLRCLVCQNQSIAESNAELAQDLRKQVREQVAAGKSDTQIIEFMTSRYGDFVLYRPPLKGITLLLWFGPLLLAAIGVLIAWRMLRARKLQADGVAPLTEAERARAEKLLHSEGSTK